MQNAQEEQRTWRVSSFCSTGNCVQAAREGESILVRDSKDPGVVLTYSIDDWNAFLDRITEGGLEFSA